MKNCVLLFSLLFIVLGVMAGCKKEPSVVSDEEIVDDHGNVVVESVFQDGSKLYFKLLSDATAEVVGRESFYGSDSNLGYQYRGEVVIPSSITHLNHTYNIVAIGEGAFENCKLVETVIIPNSVVNIKDRAFQLCSNMVSCSIPSGLEYIGEQTFFDCESLYGELVIPNTVNSIKEATFSGCKNITAIIIPNSISSIERLAFNNCCSLTSIHLPNELKVVGEKCFYGSGITSITIPSTVTSIGQSSFANTSLKTIYFEEGSNLKSIGNSAFHGCPLESLDLPNSLNTIGDGAFANCKELLRVTIPESMQRIGKKAFFGCEKLYSLDFNAIECSIELESVYFDGGVLQGCINWLSGCTELNNLTFGNSVRVVPYCSFFDCSSLDGNLILPSSVTKVEARAFAHCHYETITCLTPNPPLLETQKYYEYPFYTVYPFYCDTILVPSESVEDYKAAPVWSDLRDKIIGF